MDLFSKLAATPKANITPGPGQIYIEELNLHTPVAPQADFEHEGVKYWSRNLLMRSNMAALVTTMDVIERQLEVNGLKSIAPYPPAPFLPVADLTVNDAWYYTLETLTSQARKCAKIFVDYAITEVARQEKGQNMNYKVPCGKDMGRGMPCHNGFMCAACKEIVRLRNIIDQITTVQLTPEEIAKARISAVVRDLTAVEVPTSDPKYVVIGGKICNAKTKEAIPEDEPMFLFRAKDMMAVNAIFHYADNLCHDGTHRVAVLAAAQRFVDFRQQHPERMKRPDTAPS